MGCGGLSFDWRRCERFLDRQNRILIAMHLKGMIAEHIEEHLCRKYQAPLAKLNLNFTGIRMGLSFWRQTEHGFARSIMVLLRPILSNSASCMRAARPVLIAPRSTAFET